MNALRSIYEMKIAQLIDHTPSVRELVLKTTGEKEFKFRAGQFAMLHVPQGTGKPALRAYSIASTDQDSKGFRLLFKYVDNGVASTYVWNLKGEETLKFTGPFGKVFFQEPPTEQIVFLNTGTGVSQHLSYLTSLKEQYRHLRFRMYFGVRSEKDIYAEKDLQALKSTLKDFDYHFVLSRASEAWRGKKGYVQDFLNEIDYQKTPTTFYLCGNGGMIKAVKNKLIEQEGIDKGRVWSEAFD